MIQDNHLRCSCHLLWLRDWVRRWLKETRRTLLLNSELYLRNHQLAYSFTCVRPSHARRLDPGQILRWIRLIANVSNSLPFNVIRPDNLVSSDVEQLQPILELNEQELNCPSSSIAVSIYSKLTRSFLIALHLLSVLIFTIL